MAVEAIIISGPRRGDVITVQDDMTIEPPEQVVEALNDALKKLDAAIVSVIEELQLEQRALRNDAEVRLRALERMQAQSAGENLTGRIVALEQTVAHLSQAVARLEEARATCLIKR